MGNTYRLVESEEASMGKAGEFSVLEEGAGQRQTQVDVVEWQTQLPR